MGGHCGHRRAGDAHAKAHHKQYVQSHVHRAAEHQEAEGCTGVAHGPKYAAGQVVQHYGHHAAEDVDDVSVGLVHDVLGGADPAQYGLGGQRRGHRHHRRDATAQVQRVGEVLAHAVGVALAEGLGHRDGTARAHAQQEAEDHKIQRAGGADAREGLHAYKPAHDDAVGKVVHLLEQVAQQHRKPKGEYQFEGRTVGHIPNHGEILLSIFFSACRMIYGQIILIIYV